MSCVFCNLDNLKHGYRKEAYRVVSFTPLDPVVPGHVCVMPTEHVEDVSTDPTLTSEVMFVVAEIAKQYPQCNVITSKGRAATQSVDHLHVHIVPRTEGDGLQLPWSNQHAAK